MTVEQALAKIKALQVNALTRAAEVGMVAVKPMIPIDSGRLRNTTKIEQGDGFVDMVSGGKGSGAEEYAAYQYGTGNPSDKKQAQRHLKGGAGLEQLRKLTPPEMKKSLRGQTAEAKYGAAYRFAVDMDLLQRFPGGVRWFNIMLKDDQLQSKMMRVYARAMQ